jgi:hypothetical protein
MHRVPILRHKPLWLATLTLCGLVGSVSAQQLLQEPDWRRANDAVGAFKRGHADILKWEQANQTAESTQNVKPKGATVASAVPTIEDAVRRAWRVHPDLAQVQSRLGAQNVQMIATGRWVDLDPSLQRRVEDMGELLEVAVQARKAWVEAVTARQIVGHQQASLEAAQAASELGMRMVTLGNWSRLQQSPVQLAEAKARMELRRAKLAATQAQSKMIKLLGLAGFETSLVLPEQLPDVPATAMSEADLQKSAAAIRGQLPYAEELRNKALARSAIEAYLAAHNQALDSRNFVLKEREYITEETVLHYNGMLKSVWDLLEATRNQSQATADAIGAQRDFWIAEADLQWVLQGGAPSSFVSLSGGSGESAVAAGH